MSFNVIGEFKAAPIGLTAGVRSHLRFIKAQKEAESSGRSDARVFSEAVCFSIENLQEVLNQAKGYLDKLGVSSDAQNIAFYNIINDNTARVPAHLRNKPSIMLVGSKVEADEVTGEVKLIENELTKSVGRLSQTLKDDPEQIDETNLPDITIPEYPLNFFDLGNKHP